MDLNEKLVGVIVDATCTLRPDNTRGSPKKSVTLHFDFSKCTVQDVLERAIAPVRINFQNNNRKHFADLANEYTLEVEPVGTKGMAISSEDKMLAAFGKLDSNKQSAILDKLLAINEKQA
jgi:hypothetical protein